MKIWCKYIMVIWSLAFLSSCRSDEEKYACSETLCVAEFPKEMELSNPEIIPLNLQGCVDVLAIDSLVISKMAAGSYFWKVYSLNSNRMLANLMRKGHGHSEISSLPSSEFLEKTDSALYCSFWDSSSQNYVKCNLTKSLECGQESFESQTKCVHLLRPVMSEELS